MRRAAVAVAGAALLVAGCAPGAGLRSTRAPAPPEVSWIAGPTAEVRSLVLRPAVVGTLTARDSRPMDLAVGAFLAEMRTDGRPVHTLALLLQLDGDDPAMSVDLFRGLLLEVDGDVYVGGPPPGDEGYVVQAIPLSSQDGHRLRLLVEQLPVEASLGVRPRHLAQATDG